MQISQKILLFFKDNCFAIIYYKFLVIFTKFKAAFRNYKFKLNIVLVFITNPFLNVVVVIVVNCKICKLWNIL